MRRCVEKKTLPGKALFGKEIDVLFHLFNGWQMMAIFSEPLLSGKLSHPASTWWRRTLLCGSGHLAWTACKGLKQNAESATGGFRMIAAANPYWPYTLDTIT